MMGRAKNVFYLAMRLGVVATILLTTSDQRRCTAKRFKRFTELRARNEALCVRLRVMRTACIRGNIDALRLAHPKTSAPTIADPGEGFSPPVLTVTVPIAGTMQLVIPLHAVVKFARPAFKLTMLK